MADPIADGIASGALLISIAAFVRGEFRQSKAMMRDRRLGPVDDIRKTLVLVRDDFGTMVAIGGNRLDFFMAEDKRQMGQHLRDLAAQVGDKSLQRQIEAVAESWDRVSTSAPPSRIQAYVAGADNTGNRIQNQRDGKLLEAQTEIAREGADKCTYAIKSVNEIWLS